MSDSGDMVMMVVGSIQNVANTLKTKAGELDTAKSDLMSQATEAANNWKGTSATAWVDNLNQQANAVGTLAEALRSLAATAEAHAANFGNMG